MAIKETLNEPSTIRQQLYKDFWMQFNRFAASDERFTAEFKIHPYADVRKYQDYSIGQRSFHLNSLIDFKKKECKVGVYFRDVDIWKNYYDARDIIEQNIGNNLVWTGHKTKGSAYLITQLSAFDERNGWGKAFDTIINNLLLLKKEFLKHSHLSRTNWLISSNDEVFDLVSCLNENQFVDWQPSFSPSIGDIVYVYRTKPIQRICYKMIVTDINIPYRNTINDIKYWGPNHSPKGATNPDTPYHRLKLLAESSSSSLQLTELIKAGIKHAPQGPERLNGNLLIHIQNAFNNDNPYFDVIENTEGYYEGALKKVYVNRYERDRDARERCIEVHGCKCSVCGMDFEKMYGEIGHGFIHVHHIIPISTIGEEYKIDPIKDLVPVCPNCHAMLHKGKEGEVLTIDKLKEIIDKNNNN
jgi:5-methylcytosine-specific restriction protein A